MIGIAVLIVAGLSWLILRLSKKLNRRRIVYGLLAGMGMALTLFSIADRGLTAFLPPDPGTPVDAIVILGRGTDWRTSRVELSAELWNAKRAPLIFVSGINDAPKMLQMFSDQGIPAIALDGENCSLTTAENALFTAAILQARNMKKIILVTDGSHLWRSLLDFQSQNFQQVIAIASPFPAGMSRADKTILVAREYFFLMTSGLYQLFTGQRITSWNSPNSENLVQLARAYGKAKIMTD
jgi:uncharacterized SAM-binding protein YcdF (DUF218 family)